MVMAGTGNIVAKVFKTKVNPKLNPVARVN